MITGSAYDTGQPTGGAPVTCGCGTHPTRPHRAAGLAAVPRHDDVRPAVRRADVASPSSTAPPRAGSRSSTPPTSTRWAATLDTVGRTEEIVGRWLQGRRDRVHPRHEVLRPRRARRRGTRATPASTSSTRSTRRCAGSAPTTSTSTSCTAPTRPRRSTRRSRRSTTSCARARSRYVGCSNFLAYQVARAIGRSEALRPRALRLGAAPLQPAVPRDRARAAAAVRGGGHRRHPLQPARRRAAHRQARPAAPPPEGTRFTLGTRRPDVPGPLLARARVRHRRRAAAAGRQGRGEPGDARGRVGAGEPDDHGAASSARAARSSSARQPGRRRVHDRRRAEERARQAHHRVPAGRCTPGSWRVAAPG